MYALTTDSTSVYFARMMRKLFRKSFKMFVLTFPELTAVVEQLTVDGIALCYCVYVARRPLADVVDHLC